VDRADFLGETVGGRLQFRHYQNRRPIKEKKKMKKIELSLIMERQPIGEHYIDWHGYDVNVPGLAVCKIPRRNYHIDKYVEGHGWRVVHIKTGRYIGISCLNHRKDAAEFAERLGAVCSWLKPRMDLLEYADEIEAVIDGFIEENAAAVSAPKRG